MQLQVRTFKTERFCVCRCESVHTCQVTCTAVAAPVVRLLFVVQHFPSKWQAASPLYPGFVKESWKCQRVPLTPTGFLSCGSNQRWEVLSMPRHTSRKLSTLLLPLLLLFFSPPQMSSPIMFICHGPPQADKHQSTSALSLLQYSLDQFLLVMTRVRITSW